MVIMTTVGMKMTLMMITRRNMLLIMIMLMQKDMHVGHDEEDDGIYKNSNSGFDHIVLTCINHTRDAGKNTDDNGD